MPYQERHTVVPIRPATTWRPIRLRVLPVIIVVAVTGVIAAGAGSLTTMLLTTSRASSPLSRGVFGAPRVIGPSNVYYLDAPLPGLGRHHRGR